MVAVVGFHNAGVAGLAGAVEAPVVEGADHLAGIHVLIQAAVVLGAGVGGLLGSQGGEAVFGGLALLPFVQQVLGGLLGGSLLLVRVGGVAAVVGGAAFKAGQNVPDVYQGELIVGGAGVVDGVVAGDGGHFVAVLIGRGGGAGNVGLVAFLPAAVADPVGNDGADGGVAVIGQGSAGGGGIGIHFQLGNGGIEVGHALDVSAGDGLGIGLGGGSLLLVGSLVIQVAAGGQVVLIVGVGVVDLGVLAVLGGYLIGGEGQAVLIAVLVAAGGQVGPQIVLVALQGGTLAVHGLQVIHRLGVAVDTGIERQVGGDGIDLVLAVLVQLVAVLFGLLADGVDGLGALLGRGQEVVCPGLAGLFIVSLLVQSLAGVQAEQGQVGAVLGVEAVDGVDEVVAQLRVAHGGVPQGQGHGIFLPGAAVGNGPVDANGCGYHHQKGQHHAEGDGIGLGFLVFLVLRQLAFGQLGGVFFSTKLLLAGCTHGIISSRYWCANGIFADRPAYYNRKEAQLQEGNGGKTKIYKVKTPGNRSSSGDPLWPYRIRL